MPTKFVFGFAFCSCVLAATLLRADEPKSGEAKKSAAAAADDKAAAADNGKLRGRLPQYFSKVDVTSEQRQKIYKIQASYAAKMDALEKQLEDLKAQSNAEARAVLTADQQAKLDELLGERKTKKSKEVKTAAAPETSPAADSNQVTKSAAK